MDRCDAFISGDDDGLLRDACSSSVIVHCLVYLATLCEVVTMSEAVVSGDVRGGQRRMRES